jgi:hypothetical protein
MSVHLPKGFLGFIAKVEKERKPKYQRPNLENGVKTPGEENPHICIK